MRVAVGDGLSYLFLRWLQSTEIRVWMGVQMCAAVKAGLLVGVLYIGGAENIIDLE